MRLARGITLIEVLVVMSVIVVAVAIVLPSLGGHGHGPGVRRLRDATQVAQLHKAMVIWSQSNADRFPLPSLVDKLNSTVPEVGHAKDTTAAIYSMMVFTGSVPSELVVSPMENSPHVQVCEDYEYENPKAAVDPAKALWDPKFSAVLDGSKPGNTSYAHLQPSGTRFDRYYCTSDPAEPNIGTRGPEIAGLRQNGDGSVTPSLANPKSNALRFFNQSKGWSGNMAFNGNHVDFLKDWLVPGKPFNPKGRTYTAADGKQWPDIWCYDEPDDPKAANDYLGIFLKAGNTPQDFKAAWD